MKIKKGIFLTELEITPDEIMEFIYKLPVRAQAGLFRWLKSNFDLDLTTSIKTK